MNKEPTPATAEIEPLDKGGIEARVNVPTYSGGATFSIRVERDDDGDWRVFVPSSADMSDVPMVTESGHEFLNGIAYLGAPEEN